MAVDVDEVRRNVGRLAAVQGVVLALVLAWGVLGAGLSVPLLAAVALLPVLLALWGFLYLRWMTAARDAGARDADYRGANARALRLLGALAAVWVVALVAAIVLA